jgi:hypothetical protein
VDIPLAAIEDIIDASGAAPMIEGLRQPPATPNNRRSKINSTRPRECQTQM